MNPLKEHLGDAEAARTARRVRMLLVLVLVLLLARLIFGETPWSSGLEERAAAGKMLRAKDFARTYGWWAAAVLVPLAAALLATVPRWLRRGAPPAHLSFAARPVSRAVGGLLVAAMLTGGLLAAPRLSQSLFHDERENVMHAIDGMYVESAGGGVEFVDRRWTDTLWWYEIPANHAVHSILARLSLSAWRLVADPEHQLVNEVALRVPAFAAGVASIGALGLLLARQGRPLAGVVAAWILALHPWHMRYASEARGYSLGLLGVPLLLMSLAASLERGTWLRWIAYGTVQLLLVWNHASFVYFVAATNLAALFVLLRRRDAAEANRQQVSRWLVVNLAGAGLWVWFMAPAIPQFAAFSQLPTENFLDARRLADVVAHLLVGAFSSSGADGSLHWGLDDALASAPLLAAAAITATVLLVGAGAYRLLAAGRYEALIVPVLVVPPLVSALAAWITGANFFPQYLISALPSLVVLIAVGIAWAASPLPPAGRVALAACIVGAFAVATQPARQILRTRSIQPVRESVALARPDMNPEDPAGDSILTVSFDHFSPTYYDPRIRAIKTPDELRSAMADADATGRPLFVNAAHLRAQWGAHSSLTEFVSDPTLFEELADLPGLLPRDRRRVWRYLGSAARDG